MSTEANEGLAAINWQCNYIDQCSQGRMFEPERLTLIVSGVVAQWQGQLIPLPDLSRHRNGDTKVASQVRCK